MTTTTTVIDVDMLLMWVDIPPSPSSLNRNNSVVVILLNVLWYRPVTVVTLSHFMKSKSPCISDLKPDERRESVNCPEVPSIGYCVVINLP